MCIGELLGTFILVMFGISSVAIAVIFNAYSGLLQVAVVWGLGVTLAIYATRHLSCAHLNPAVSLAMVCAGRMHPRLLPGYWAAQLLGAIVAGSVVYLLFQDSILQFELARGIVRGMPESVQTAMLFGEYFPNPANHAKDIVVSRETAMLAEGIGTFLLVMMIFLLTEGCNVGRPEDGLAPVFVGGTVTAIIAIIAPLTQAGLNPARDFGPRLVAWYAGWDNIAIPGPQQGLFLVYVVSPLIGGVAAAACFRLLLAKVMTRRGEKSVCTSPSSLKKNSFS